MGEFVNNVLSDIEIKTIGGCRTDLRIDGETVRCSSYTLEQNAGELPVVAIEIIPNIKDVKLKGIVEIENKEKIAMLMSESEFEKFCTIWRLIHDQKELLE